MNETDRFAAERKAALAGYATDAPFRGLSVNWMHESMTRRYVYNFDWLGRPIIQYPQDILAMQQIVWATRPDLIIETGIAHGGSLVLSASLLAVLDYCDAAAAGEVLDPARPQRKVLGIDIDIRAHNRAALEAHPMAARIEMIEGSSVAPEIVAAVKERARDAKRVMVCLDSNHTHAHVLAELEAYAGLVTPGCYCIVFDTLIELLPANTFPDRPWDLGDNAMTAAREWCATHPEFEVDRTVDSQLMISAAPEGYLRRKGI